MFNIEKYNVAELKQQFLNAEPFNFIVIDNFLDPLVIKDVELELRTLPNDEWYDKETAFSHINNQKDCATQSKKIALNIRKQIPKKTNDVIDLFSSPQIIKFIEDITDIPALQPELRDQSQYYSALVNTGIISPNEARDALGFEGIDGYDDLRVPANIAGSAVNPDEGGRPVEAEGEE